MTTPIKFECYCFYYLWFVFKITQWKCGNMWRYNVVHYFAEIDFDCFSLQKNYSLALTYPMNCTNVTTPKCFFSKKVAYKKYQFLLKETTPSDAI